jgi:hypothetical protein
MGFITFVNPTISNMVLCVMFSPPWYLQGHYCVHHGIYKVIIVYTMVFTRSLLCTPWHLQGHYCVHHGIYKVIIVYITILVIVCYEAIHCSKLEMGFMYKQAIQREVAKCRPQCLVRMCRKCVEHVAPMCIMEQNTFKYGQDEWINGARWNIGSL